MRPVVAVRRTQLGLLGARTSALKLAHPAEKSQSYHQALRFRHHSCIDPFPLLLFLLAKSTTLLLYHSALPWRSLSLQNSFPKKRNPVFRKESCKSFVATTLSNSAVLVGVPRQAVPDIASTLKRTVRDTLYRVPRYQYLPFRHSLARPQDSPRNVKSSRQ